MIKPELFCQSTLALPGYISAVPGCSAKYKDGLRKHHFGNLEIPDQLLADSYSKKLIRELSKYFPHQPKDLGSLFMAFVDNCQGPIVQQFKHEHRVANLDIATALARVYGKYFLAPVNLGLEEVINHTGKLLSLDDGRRYDFDQIYQDLRLDMEELLDYESIPQYDGSYKLGPFISNYKCKIEAIFHLLYVNYRECLIRDIHKIRAIFDNQDQFYLGPHQMYYNTVTQIYDYQCIGNLLWDDEYRFITDSYGYQSLLHDFLHQPKLFQIISKPYPIIMISPGNPDKRVPAPVRLTMWQRYFGKVYYGVCHCCNKQLEIDNYEAGHVWAAACGGSNHLDNLRPVCGPCNKSMGSMHMGNFIRTHGLFGPGAIEFRQ